MIYSSDNAHTSRTTYQDTIALQIDWEGFGKWDKDGLKVEQKWEMNLVDVVRKKLER